MTINYIHAQACANDFGLDYNKFCSALRKYVAVAALPGGGGDDWQPIDTAPKDGTVVFVTVAAKDAEIEKGYFNRGAWYVVNNGDYFDGGHGNDYRTTSVPGNGNYGLPTHWRPLPSAPTPSPHEADRNG